MAKENIAAFCKELEETVQKAYEESVMVEEAERLAARMLQAQMVIARELEQADLDARMRKNGLKAVRAAVYMAEVDKYEKKPSEGFLEAAVNMAELVTKESNAYEEKESRRDSLERYLAIFKDAHIYFRAIAKGRFE